MVIYLTSILAWSILTVYGFLCSIEPSTVQPQTVVKVVVDEGTERQLGSGVLIKQNQVLTCHHVVRDRTKDGVVTVQFANGMVKEAKVIKEDKTWDLALLEFSPVYFFPTSLATKPVEKKDVVKICGFPGGKEYKEVVGSVVGFRSPTTRSDPYMFTVSEQAKSGMSGGPVFNHKKELVGILFGSRIYANCTGLQAIQEFLK